MTKLCFNFFSFWWLCCMFVLLFNVANCVSDFQFNVANRLWIADKELIISVVWSWLITKALLLCYKTTLVSFLLTILRPSLWKINHASCVVYVSFTRDILFTSSLLFVKLNSLWFLYEICVSLKCLSVNCVSVGLLVFS